MNEKRVVPGIEDLLFKFDIPSNDWVDETQFDIICEFLRQIPYVQRNFCYRACDLMELNEEINSIISWSLITPDEVIVTYTWRIWDRVIFLAISGDSAESASESLRSKFNVFMVHRE